MLMLLLSSPFLPRTYVAKDEEDFEEAFDAALRKFDATMTTELRANVVGAAKAVDRKTESSGER